ncbi:MAG: potassium channel protein [Bacteroidia bacterium]|nr:potassium channel protein [Bacteroidia bacterium]
MNSSSSVNRVALPLLLLILISVVGTVGYSLIEGYQLVDAIYMTAITMSTVGFGTVRELSSEGKIFSVFLIVFSAGTFIYAITNITTFVVEGEVKHIFDRYQVSKRVSKLKDHIIICGLGRNGRETALELMKQGHPFVIVEANEEVIADFQQHHDALIVQGDATLEEVLQRANIAEARGLVSSLSTDAENVYITLTARGMNPRLKIIARASLESSISKLKRAGANQVIVPNLIGGRKMANLITRPALVEFVEMVSGDGNPNLHLEDIACQNYPRLLGKTLRELEIRSITGVLVLGYKRGDRAVELNPHTEEKIMPEDRLFIMGTDSQLASFRQTYLEL